MTDAPREPVAAAGAVSPPLTAGEALMADEVDRVELSAPARPEILELVHALFEHLWACHEHVPAGLRIRFETAAVEVLANIVEHAFAHDQRDGEVVRGRRLEVALAVSPDSVLASFRDNGLPAELDLSAAVMPDEEAESGRGLALTLAAVDDLTYDRTDGRNHWSLRCDLPSA